MTTTPRSEKIRSILEARRPMAERVQKADETLNRIESQIRSFKQFIPQYANRLDPEAASAVSALLPDTDDLLAGIAHEKGRLALLSGRYSRPTLNIGVVGQARQGKSQLLQSITGLSPNEIPSGDGGHCTGAPSVVVNHQGETFANLTFHSESSFLENVIQPFFARLNLTGCPSMIEGLKTTPIPKEGSEEARKYGATETEHLKKLLIFQENIDSYKDLLGGAKRRIEKDQIRDFVAQEDLLKKPIYKWIAVQLAEIYCEFPHADVGNIALADTPGLGDFQSGAEQRLAATIGSRLDSALMLRLPPSVGAVVKPEDTGLHDLIQQAVPDLTADDWSYFVINTYPAKSPDVAFFESELRKSAIKTRSVHKVDVGNTTEVAAFLDQLLNEISANLKGLDQQLFEKQLQSLKTLTATIATFAEKAGNVLPKAALLQPEDTLLEDLFGEVWDNLGKQLKDLVGTYKSCRNEPDQEFLAALSSVFANLDEGPKLPAPNIIDRLAANMTLATWSNEKLLELRVNMASSFESIDSSLHSCFEKLRNDVLEILLSDTGGKLASLVADNKVTSWQILMDRWIGLRKGDEMRHAIELFMSSGLSFRGFIQPRVRHCLDVLDSDCPQAAPFRHAPGDTSAEMKDKIELAWQKACFNCKSKIEDMAKEPAMARFAAVEDFRESIVHMGGQAQAKTAWLSFYKQNRPDIWPKEFSQMAAETALRKEWDETVRSLSETSKSLFDL